MATVGADATRFDDQQQGWRRRNGAVSGGLKTKGLAVASQALD
jgi:hypothetical protein